MQASHCFACKVRSLIKVAKLSVSSDGSDDSASSFHHDDESDSDDSHVDPEYAKSDKEELPVEDNPRWQEFNLSGDKNKNTHQHFASAFNRYLLHVEGRSHSNKQALIHMHQVHSMMDDIDEKGKDLSCLVQNDSMDMWG